MLLKSLSSMMELVELPPSIKESMTTSHGPSLQCLSIIIIVIVIVRHHKKIVMVIYIWTGGEEEEEVMIRVRNNQLRICSIVVDVVKFHIKIRKNLHWGKLLEWAGVVRRVVTSLSKIVRIHFLRHQVEIQKFPQLGTRLNRLSSDSIWPKWEILKIQPAGSKTKREFKRQSCNFLNKMKTRRVKRESNRFRRCWIAPRTTCLLVGKTRSMWCKKNCDTKKISQKMVKIILLLENHLNWIKQTKMSYVWQESKWDQICTGGNKYCPVSTQVLPSRIWTTCWN